MALAVENISDGLEAGAANGPLVPVHVCGLVVKPEQQHVATHVENRVDTSREEGQGLGSDGSIHCITLSFIALAYLVREETNARTLQDAKEDVCNKTGPNGNLDLRSGQTETTGLGDADVGNLPGFATILLPASHLPCAPPLA